MFVIQIPTVSSKNQFQLQEKYETLSIHTPVPFQDSESEESDTEDELTENHEKAPKLKMAAIKHVGCINRIRYKALGSASVVAAW